MFLLLGLPPSPPVSAVPCSEGLKALRSCLPLEIRAYTIGTASVIEAAVEYVDGLKVRDAPPFLPAIATNPALENIPSH